MLQANVAQLLLLASTLLAGDVPDCQAGSFLHRYLPCQDGVYRQQVQAYQPKEGDLVFFEDFDRRWALLFRMVGSGQPTHMGLIVRRSDGSLAVLESGPDWKKHVYLQPAQERLRSFKGGVWIRRVKKKLTPEASQRLTEFAEQQVGKRYATGRLLLQGTPVCARLGLRYRYFAHTYVERTSWLCSEIVVAGGTVAGLFNPECHPANAIYPRDLVDDAVYPLLHNWEEIGLWTPTPEPSCLPVSPKDCR